VLPRLKRYALTRIAAGKESLVAVLSRWVASLVGVLALAGAAQAQPTLAEPAFVFKPVKGFIDDPFAVDGEQERLAVLRTDSASFALVELVDLSTGKTERAYRAGNPQQLFDRLLIVPGGGTLVVSRDPGNGKRTAQYFTPDGKPAGLAGPATDFATMTRGGHRYLVGWDRRPGSSGETVYTVTQYQLSGLRRVGGPHAYSSSKEGMLARPPLKIAGWQDGYSQVMGQRPGGYDKKQDVRQPDRAAVFDLFTGAFVRDQEIGDVMAWASAADLRRTRPNRALMAVLSDDLDAVALVDAYGRRTPLPLEARVSNYQPRSLAEQEDAAAGTLYFSLSLDPLNPEALSRQKADKAYLDLYRVRHQSGAARGPETAALLRAPLDDRPVSWVLGGRYLALLRKHKSFSRGGTEIEVYRLP
jgi:hypothetical protein